MVTKHEKEYLKQVCGHVKWKQAHENICTELSQHMEEIREDKMHQGISEEEASQMAVREMGDSTLVGESMNKAYRPRISLHALGMLICIILMGLVCRIPTYESFVQMKEIVSLCIGAGIFVFTAYFVDLRKMMKHAEKIAFGYGFLGFAMTIALLLFGQGFHYLLLQYLERLIICWGLFQPIIVVLMIRSHGEKGLFGFVQTIAFCLFTMLPILVVPDLASLILMIIADSALLMYGVFSGKYGSRKLAMVVVFVISAAIVAIVVYFMGVTKVSDYISNVYYMRNYQRFTTTRFGHPKNIAALLRETPFIGKTNASEMVIARTAIAEKEEIHLEFMILDLASRWGTWVYLAAALLIVGFMGLLLCWCLRNKELFVRMICVAVLGVYFIQAMQYLLLNLGWLNFSILSLPFLSPGNTLMIANFVLMGVLFAAAGSGWLYEKTKQTKTA